MTISTPDTITVSHHYFIQMLEASKKKAPTRRWLSKESPSKEEWIANVEKNKKNDVEKLTFSIDLCMDTLPIH